jgi:RimJ/RimL family protein N-acetyltransferase
LRGTAARSRIAPSRDRPSAARSVLYRAAVLRDHRKGKEWQIFRPSGNQESSDWYLEPTRGGFAWAMDGCSKVAVFQTMNLTLSPCRPSDRGDFMDLERDPDVMRFLNGGHPVDQEQSDPDATFLMPRGTEAHVWTARRITSGAFVGWFCLWPENERIGEPGYRLRRMDWGQGLAAEGASALVDWGFASGRYDEIVACTMAANRASRRVLEKIGLKYIRTVCVDWADAIPGGGEGEVEYALMRSDWNGS